VVTGNPATGIVLAGGAARRFGRDKLAEPVAGRSLLAAALAAVAAVCEEIVLVVAPGPPDPAAGTAIPARVRVVRDPVAHEGPLAGLATGLAATTTPLALVVAGDMPGLVPSVLDALLRRLEDGQTGGRPAGTRAVLAVLHDGERVGPLPCSLRVGEARAGVEALLATGERRLRAILDTLPRAVIPFAEWRALDPAGASLRDVDRPEDLAPG